MKFRLKISLLSLCISGIVLIAFGIFFILVFHRVGIDRLDREIRTLGDANLVKSREHPPWERFGDSLKFVYGEQEIERLAVFVFDTSDITLFKSDGFPEALAAVPIPPSPVGDEADERVDESQDDWRPPRRGPGRRPPPRGHHPPFGGPDVDAEWEGPPDHPDPDRRREPRGMRRPLLREPLFSTLEADGKRWRVGAMGDRRVIMIVGVDLSAFDAEVGRFRTALFVATPISLMLLALGGWLLAGRALRPIIAITETAEGITATDLDQRVPAVASDAELVRLVDVINGMLDRLERSFSQAMRFSADAAHELQTPLTILQGELDHAVQQAQPESEEQQRYSNLLEEVQGLKAIIQKLLVLARADAGELTLNREPVDLSELVASAAEDAGVIGPELRIEQSIAPGVTVMGDV
ncbi:MAG: HAMP domain-containing protein, partial [Verrucomicrobia bacterium]|nr:HAMP domain-containing protein [Verrucomicrobiota bacterium]